ncbi:hypothetical protein GBA65_17295 [Rubrobacter marinus]|uniref:Uncharacterized protein n=1 Tax=Rubrobacter marinus TaxID=2653852 RepID=A0A6G8Q0K6_9ACTN|nr:hypothetical protein [Rubrobacter marinus]QIN79985.1 hypothetical protein GBA65_17295 [Rubrobacter marinus]
MTLDQLLGRERRDLFVPLSFRLSARLEQTDWEEMVEDTVYATFALRNGSNLFGADGVVNWFDTHLESEAAGAVVERDEMGRVTQRLAIPDSIPDAGSVMQRGAIPAALEVARRLCEETLDKSAVLGYLTGLRTLLNHLFGEGEGNRLLQAASSGEAPKEDRDTLEDTFQISLQLARAYCEAGVGGLLLAEEAGTDVSASARLLAPVFNIANYYGVPVMLLSRGPLTPRAKEEALQAGFRYVAAPDDGDPPEQTAVRSVPTALCVREEAPVEDWVREQRGRGGGARIYVSEWELPAEAIPENLIELGRSLKS